MLRFLLHTEILAGVMFGLFAVGWWPLIGASFSTAAFVGWWRIFFAVRRLKGDGVGPQLLRDARNLALCSGEPDDMAAARRIINTRELPPITFRVYFAAAWFSLLPILIIAAVILSIRHYLL